MTDEQAIIGWKAIAYFFNVTERQMLNRKKSLEEVGAIFYTYKGRPPKRTRVVCAFPSVLQKWIAIKTMKGEKF